jgi:hypothetical protein
VSHAHPAPVRLERIERAQRRLRGLLAPRARRMRGRRPDEVPESLQRAYRIQRALKRALRRKAALEYRARYWPNAQRWDDGPCYAVALAARCAAGEGVVVETHRGRHAMLLVGGRWLVDPYSVRPAHRYSCDAIGIHHFVKRRRACAWYPGCERPAPTFTRLIREALEKEQPR